MMIVGIDCAVDPGKVGIAIATYRQGRATVTHTEVGSKRRPLAAQIAERLETDASGIIAIDSPLGWPVTMGRELIRHSAGAPLSTPANDLFRRETDRHVRANLGKQSLDVGADRIARTAHAALALLEDLRRETGSIVPLAWSPDLEPGLAAIEVYPAATLRAHGIREAGYKRPEQRDARKEILSGLKDRLAFDTEASLIESNADALDAVVCVLAGVDFLRGEAVPPIDQTAATAEGWIWVRKAP